MTITQDYKIQLPSYDVTIPNITFSSTLSGVIFNFTFEWFNNQWNGWATFNGITREIGVTPYILNWLNYFDYMIVFDTALDEIGKADLVNTNIWVYQWQ